MMEHRHSHDEEKQIVSIRSKVVDELRKNGCLMRVNRGTGHGPDVCIINESKFYVIDIAEKQQ